MRAVWMTAVVIALLAPPPVAAGAARLTPVLAHSVVVAPVTGKVRVKAAGEHRSAVLRAARVVPTGSFIDATRGKVRIVSADTAVGKTQSGKFDGGAFVVRQARTALTDLILSSTRKIVGICGARGAASKPLPPKVIRKLRGNAKGKFRTIGRFAAATVRGTEWTTEDRCDGTLTEARRGVVVTSVGTQSFTLTPGTSIVAYCFPPGSAFRGPQYCEVLILTPAAGIFGWGIGTRIATTDTYDVCIRGPNGRESCTTRPLSPPDDTGLRVGEVVCQQGYIGGPGVYSVRWFFGGQQLGVPLTFIATLPKPAQPGEPCLQRP